MELTTAKTTQHDTTPKLRMLQQLILQTKQNINNGFTHIEHLCRDFPTAL